MTKQIIQTDQAPSAIGTYSQAVKAGGFLWVSGQIPLDPKTMQVVSGDFRAQITQVFENVKAILAAAQLSFAHLVKMTIYLTDLNAFSIVNEVMAHYVQPPFPARAVVQISALPKASLVEIDVVAQL